MTDNVNHPEHYTRFGKSEVIDITEQLNFNRGNVVKYVTRAGAKAGSDEKEDLHKAEWYLRREIKRLGVKPATNHPTELRHTDEKKALTGVAKDIERDIMSSDLHTHLKMALAEVLHGLTFALGDRKGRDFPKELLLFPTGTDGRYQGLVSLLIEAATKDADRKEIPLTEAKSLIDQLLREVTDDGSGLSTFSELYQSIHEAIAAQKDPKKRLYHLLEAEQTLDNLIYDHTKKHNLDPEKVILP